MTKFHFPVDSFIRSNFDIKFVKKYQAKITRTDVYLAHTLSLIHQNVRDQIYFVDHLRYVSSFKSNPTKCSFQRRCDIIKRSHLPTF